MPRFLDLPCCGNVAELDALKYRLQSRLEEKGTLRVTRCSCIKELVLSGYVMANVTMGMKTAVEMGQPKATANIAAVDQELWPECYVPEEPPPAHGIYCKGNTGYAIPAIMNCAIVCD